MSGDIPARVKNFDKIDFYPLHKLPDDDTFTCDLFLEADTSTASLVSLSCIREVKL